MVIMKDKTTIQVTKTVQSELDARKEGDESYNTVLKRLLENGGTLWTEEEIRKLVRSEIEAAQSRY